MTAHGDAQMSPADRARLLKSLDRMVENGRVTAAEAAGLRAATAPDEFDGIVRSIRVRHAGAKLNAAAQDGCITQQVADANIERLRNGEDPRSVRALLGGNVSSDVSFSVAAATLFAEGHGPGRNPWWVNVILVALAVGGITVWRIRAARKRRSTHTDGIDPAGRR